ncbi:MAG: RecQ family ATP-dependent DNA helicase [Sphaerochaetaceae bacterium]|jgi:ATP-dependent DNA helicase RecQ|nr:RecQ family ATP-dependent DNA helicase [Sphaerochaetaceae bacterium]NLY07301.1 ATP-dependent DNA helicase RecQ [Spirochaetales bacterium]
MDIQKLMKKTAREKFGITAIKPYQNLVIQTILEHAASPRIDSRKQPANTGQLVVFPTGYGKSLCFLLPSVMLNGISVIIYPLLALMNDQASHLSKNGIAAEIIRGGQTSIQRREIWNRLKSRKTKILITTPESLCTEQVISELRQLPIALLTVDEAHVVCEWGRTFRPAYLKLLSAIRTINPRQVLAFTATASRLVITRLKQCLFGGLKPHIIIADPDRTNIHYSVVRTLSRRQTLLEIVCRCNRPVLIFAGTRIATEEVFLFLKHKHPKYNMRFYHAGLRPEERTMVENWFKDTEDGIMVSTCAYGLGMDKAGIRTVIHYAIPSSIEEFLQESGRAGRDGKQSRSIILTTPADAKEAEKSPSLRKRALLSAIISTNRNQCLRTELLALMDHHVEHCSGCCTCDGTFEENPHGMIPILSAVMHHQCRFGTNSLAVALSNAYPCPMPLNTMPGWTFENIQEAIKALLDMGMLKKIRIGLRRRVLICPDLIPLKSTCKNSILNPCRKKRKT